MIFVLDKQTGKGTRFRDGDQVRVELPGGAAVEGRVLESGGMRLDDTSRKDMSFKKNYLYFQLLPLIEEADKGLHYLVVSLHCEAPPGVPGLPLDATVELLAVADGAPLPEPDSRSARMQLAAMQRLAAPGQTGDEYRLCLIA